MTKNAFPLKSILLLFGISGIFLAGIFVGIPFIDALSKTSPESKLTIPFEDEPISNEIPQSNQEDIGTPNEEIEEILMDANPDEDLIQIGENPENTTPDPDPNTVIVCTDSIPPDCQEEEQIISEDPPIEQIIDEIPEEELLGRIQVCPPLCGSNKITMTSLITKTDSAGEITFTTERLDIPLASFFVEDTTNIDYSKGFLEIRTKLFPSNPDLLVTGTAFFDILINNKSVLSQPINYQVNGKPCFIVCPIPAVECQDDLCEFVSFNIGSVNGNFVSPTGIKSGSFLFSIEDNLDKFDILQGVNVLEFVLLDVDIKLTQDVQCVTSPCDPVIVENFGANKLVLFTMDIARDPNLIIITDEAGGTSRIFPTDDRFRFTNSGDRFIDGLNCRSYWARNAGTIELFDSTNNLIKSSPLPHRLCATFTAIDVVLQRDQQYRLVHILSTHPQTEFDITFTTTKSQKDYYVGCYWSNSIGVGCTYPSPDGTEILRAPPLP